ncbi:hypothetical protein AAFF_G00340370 [Aldrovandia affinis]|uniref:Centrosomal protein of 112 kDa n=1 Tax=Aldrovandia affinis TaxID=143900 RepID=A0AAD7WQ47_9TELE|nr:hypothetical protein AAFF_G00340370 [Aldrovandia affinis]
MGIFDAALRKTDLDCINATMSQQEDSWERLDSEFDHHLVDMKPHVLKLPQKSEEGFWAPFTHKPESGALKTLPTYMLIYFDDPLLGGTLDQNPATLPDWVSSELGHCEETASPVSRRIPNATSSPHAHRRRHTHGDKLPPHTRATSAPTQSANEEDQTCDRRRALVMSSDDSDLDACLNSWNLGIEKPRYLREKPIPLSPICLKTSRGKNSTFCGDQAAFHSQEKEGEMKAKVLEARYQEEWLKMQQRHDADVQKILDRKNGEIEELKTMYRTKQKDLEETTRKLEKKVQSLVRESQVIRESKDKQITELRKMQDENTDSVKNEWEKKLHTAVAEMELEKFEMQKKHTENIQELLDDTNQRLSKMESEYSAQTQRTEQMAKELEARVKQLQVEVENGNILRQKVTQEKAELEIQIACISSELQESNRRAVALSTDKEELAGQHEQTVQKMQAKHEADMSHFQQEHAICLLISACQGLVISTSAPPQTHAPFTPNGVQTYHASDVIVGLEHCVTQLRQQLKDCENKRQKQLREQESRFQKESSDLLHVSEKKVRSLQNAVENEKADAKKRIALLEEALREKEEQVCRERESHRLQTQHAESALDQFKKQAELSSEKAYANMKQQMEKVEADLIRSKGLREKQAKEFSWQLEELKQRYEQKIVELKMQHEQERTHLFHQHNAEKSSLVQEHQLEIQSLEKQSMAVMVQHESQTQEWRKRDAQNMAQLEAQVHGLREELIQAHAQRKQQLVELGLLREEERQRAAQEQEALRADVDRFKQELERTHAADKRLALEKCNGKVKQIEEDYSQKLAKASQTIADLQASVCALKEEGWQQRQNAERQMQDATVRWEDERRHITHEAKQVSKALQERMESLLKQLHSAENKLRSQDLETEEQIIQIRQECHQKIKGLLPAAIRQELEDIIASLKLQINFLQKRADVQKEELEVHRSRRSRGHSPPHLSGT